MVRQTIIDQNNLYDQAVTASRQDLNLNEHVLTVYEHHLMNLAMEGHQDLENIHEEELNEVIQEGLIAGEFELHDWVDDFVDLQGIFMQVLRSGDIEGAGDTITNVFIEQAKRVIAQQLLTAYESITC